MNFCKNIKLFLWFVLSSATLLVSAPALTWVGDYVGVKVIIKGYDQKEIEAEDSLHGKIFIPRDAVPAHYKLQTGKSIILPVHVQKFSQIRSVPTASYRKLKGQAAVAFANLQKGISESKK